MSGRDYAYLDLAALPPVGSALLSSRPALLFSADGRRVLFANAAGAAFFGERRMEALFDRRFAPALPATEQIARAARSLAPGASRLERIRFAVGAGLASVAAECTRIALPDGGSAVLVRLPETHRTGGTVDAARRLVAQLAAEDCLVAVLDAEGGVIADSGDFDLLAAGSAAIEDLVAALQRTGGRVVKRAIRIGETRRPAGLAAIGIDEGRIHLLVVGPGERVVMEGEAPERDAMPPAAAPQPPVEAEVTRAEEPVGVEAPVPAAIEPELPAAVPVVTSEAPAAIVEHSVADEGEPSAADEPAVADEPAASGGFRFVEPAGPVRFVFQMDAAGRFTFVSGDFAALVGPDAAIAVGESWSEMAARLGLDPTAAVASLIARRDTWSGVSLDWPVQGSDEVVAVDLAALPAFSRDRLFEGYRGFGVIRPLERHEVPAVPPPAPPRARVPVPPVMTSGPSNVIRLARPPGAPDTERLSPPEQDAFRRIAAALGAPPAEKPATVEAPRRPEPEAQVEPPEAPAVDAAIVAAPVEPALDETDAALTSAPELPAETPDAPFAAPDGVVEAEPEPALPQAATQDEPQDEPQEEPQDGPDEEPGSGGPPFEQATPEREPAPQPIDRLGEAELAAARQRIVELEAILDTATDGVIVVDEDARIERINRSAEALFGVESAAVAGLRLPDLLAEESRKSALDYLDGLARNGVASVLNDGREVIGRVPQGGLIPLFMTMGRLPETGKFCAVLRDITQWKNAEGELINAKRAAESASMQKSDFLAKVSHEIRTPLNAIIGFSEVMMEERFGPIGTERYKEYLRDIHLSGAHLMSLLNDLLDLSKIEAGKLDLTFESVPLNEIVMECVALMQPQANRERIIIRTSLSGQVPNIVADPRSIRQIVLNLVSNAVKFTLAGGQVIVSTAMEPHGEVTLRIRDTGIGMSEKDVETALKPFRQLSTSRERRSDGTGLGLPLTKALVEANRAAFAIDSAVGQGTLIRITFPATRVLAG